MRTNKTLNRFSLSKELPLLPGYILVTIWVVFTLIMVGWVCLASLSTTKSIFSGNILGDGIHFESYKHAFLDNNLGAYTLNSIIYTSVSITGMLLIAAPASYMLARFKFRGNKFIQGMFVVAMGIPSIMVILPLFSLAAQLGVLNSRITLIIVYIFTGIPFTLFFLHTFFSNLSRSFEESAAIDGCGPIKTFWVIMLPLASPGIITVTIFNFIGIWNEFFMALIFANHSSLRPLAVGVYATMKSFLYAGDWPGMFTGVVVIFIPTLILYILLSKKIIAGVTGGAVKG
ncbi:carbohydrate ABC transporter permease [Cohnella silvisoli]|uniref:Carbohydrate ABC transporter permease n=1 Tax=Cohnella silvisoli TaxID=2873699 RepID=A0ABV1KY49_9BACL|nr:carbohydrate ABC transporter permease [Cohnella silvisoli]MCD9021868.1 carbohydrate ABC transporter permease [Cohnella silvisoli]